MGALVHHTCVTRRGQIFHQLNCGKGGSAMFKVPELFSTAHSTASDVQRLHNYMLDFIHLLATDVAETPELKQ